MENKEVWAIKIKQAELKITISNTTSLWNSTIIQISLSLNKSNKTNPKKYHCGKFFLTNKFKQSKSSKSILKLQFQTQLHKPTMKTYAFIKPFD